MKLLSSDQMRKIEQTAIEEIGIPSLILMENAAFRVTERCLKYLKKIDKPKVLIVCGQGNNGGDGLAVARHLCLKNIDVNVIYSGDINLAKGDAKTNLEIVKNLNIPIITTNNFENYDLVIDALLGTGLTRNIEGNIKQLIEEINRHAKYIISVDIPSGVHSDTGRIMGCAIKANETVTLGFPKTGLYLFPGAEYTGDIHIEYISIPYSLIEKIKPRTEILTENEARNLLPVRKKRSNKGNYGKVFVFAGSNEMPGAAALACSGAYAVGCGIVRAYVMQNVAKVINKWQREVITKVVTEKNGMYCKESITKLTNEINSASAIIVGPGIGRSPDVTEFVKELLQIAEVPLVIDADALYAISGNTDILKTLKAPCIITPHPGEMSMLTNNSPVTEILNDTIGIASNFSKEFNTVTLLKDAHTIIANPAGDININITGNNALSKAGTGDVLTGMIAGFIAQLAAKFPAHVMDVFKAGILGSFYHGKACEEACLNKSNYSITASDIINYLPIVMKK